MKLTNILLILLIGLVAFQKIPSEKKEKTVSDKKDTIVIKPVKRDYKTVIPKINNKENTKHSTTFRSYIDTDGRSTVGASHNIRVGKDYYISGGITSRESSYNKREVSGTMAITKFW